MTAKPCLQRGGQQEWSSALTRRNRRLRYLHDDGQGPPISAESGGPENRNPADPRAIESPPGPVAAPGILPVSHEFDPTRPSHARWRKPLAFILVTSAAMLLRAGFGLRALEGAQISQTRIHRFAFQGQDAEDTLVHAPERLAPHKAFEGFYSEGELADREGSLAAEGALPKARQMLRASVFKTVDN